MFGIIATGLLVELILLLHGGSSPIPDGLSQCIGGSLHELSGTPTRLFGSFGLSDGLAHLWGQQREAIMSLEWERRSAPEGAVMRRGVG